MTNETITVAHDGFGGIVVLQCSERVSRALKSVGVYDIAETDKINTRGIFEVSLSYYSEDCDCCSGHVHGYYDVFEAESAKYISELCIKSVKNEGTDQVSRTVKTPEGRKTFEGIIPHNYEQEKTCTYPKCNCPFDAPDDNFLCACGLKREQRNGKN